MNIEFSNFESSLCNISFLIGFLVTIYYWIKAIFFSDKIILRFGTGFFGFLIINFLLITQLLGRWITSGHFPLSSLYESLLFLAWGINSIYLFIEYFTNSEFIGVLIAPVLLCLLGFTGFSLPSELQEMKPLVPALQSNWLFMHVSVMMLSYAGLLIGSLLSIAFLVIYVLLKQESFSHRLSTMGTKNVTCHDVALGLNKIDNYNLEQITQTSEIWQAVTTTPNLFNIKENQIRNERPLDVVLNNNLLNLLDNLSYRIIGIGFCFLTLGILSGAVWANETWGTYWSWDPKETWALITWLTFAVYLHTRFLKGWQGVKPASIASTGFFLIWICYLGVNLLGKGLHSYGFLN